MSETLGSLAARLSKLPCGAAVDEDVLLGFINDRIENLCRLSNWTRLDQQSNLQMVAEYVTGTITIAAGATSGTGIGTTFTAAMTGRKIRPANLFPYYDFTFVSTTSFTIDRALEGTENLTAVAFRIWQPIYALPANLAEIRSLVNLTLGGDMEQQSREWLDRTAPTRYESGSPRVYVPAEDSAAGLQQIEVYPGPVAGEGLPMEWKAKAPLFDLADQGAKDEEFPDWISIPAIFCGVTADLYRLQGDYGVASNEEQRWMMLIDQLKGEDARRRPPTTMQMADRYTIHRRRRAGGGAGRFSQDPNWWREA